MFNKFLKIILRHKIIFVIIAIVLIATGYFGYKAIKGNSSKVSYISSTVEKGTIITSISGSGQVSATDQIDIKPKVSGDIIYLGVINGQEVRAGTLLAKLDNSDAQKAVRDAENNLETAKVALEQAKISEQNAEIDLKKAYEDGFTKVIDTFSDLSTAMSGLEDILFNDDGLSVNHQWNLDAYVYYTETNPVFDANSNYYKSYYAAKSLYEKNLIDYRSANRFSDENTIESLIQETYETTKNISEIIRNTTNLIQLYKEKLTSRGLTVKSVITTYLSNLDTYTGGINTDLSNLFSAEQTIQAGVGTNPLNTQSKELAVEQKEDALSDAKVELAYYSIQVPFGGIITEVNVKKGDSVSASTALATLITNQRIAEISLNEVDAAKVKIGQKVTLSFDAIEGLSIAGGVLEVDTIGTVTQGVVTYNAKIGFDTQDERVKPGMSASVEVITDVKQNVLLVPNSAIKQQEGSMYVEILKNNTLEQQTVETGLANDTVTEIISGLQEGDKVVTQTTTSSASTKTTQQNNSFQIPGIGGGR